MNIFNVLIGWNKYGEPYWDYNYNDEYDLKHEICFYRFYICW